MALDYSDWAASPEEDASFDLAPFNHEGARAKMVARITRTLKQLNGETVSKTGGKDFEPLYNNGVIYRPTLNGHSIQLPGVGIDGLRTSRSILISKLPDFARDVESGEFDGQLRAAMETKTSGTSTSQPASASKPSGATRAVGAQSALNIGVAAKRRSKTPPSWDVIRRSYIDAGSDPELVDIAIAKRKEAEKA